MAWARDNGHVVFTHDLDFGTLLALTRHDRLHSRSRRLRGGEGSAWISDRCFRSSTRCLARFTGSLMGWLNTRAKAGLYFFAFLAEPNTWKQN